MKPPQISVCIAYRDREALRVQNCLASLDQQSFRDFEVVFVDYGSQPERASEIQEICNTFPNVRHFYFDSRGQFWNPALALNFAIAQAKGETLLALDVDLMVLPDFLEKCQKTHQVIEFLTFDYVDLKPGFTQYAELASQKEALILPKQIKPINGALLLARQFLLAAGGYDPYFFIWGELDLEILDRLEALGLQKRHLPAADFPLFHQWHPPGNRDMPKGWQALIMDHSAQNRAALKKPGYQFPAFRPPTLLAKAQRPALLFAEKGDWPLPAQFVFRYPILQSYSLFMARFYSLAPGQCLWLRQDFAILQPQPKSRLGKWMQRFNRLLQKMRFSYRWVEIATYETELLTAKEIRDFLFYFVLEHEAAIQDYFLEQVGKQIFFVVCKAPTKEEKTLVRKGRKP